MAVPRRNFGLDIARAAAIIMVLVSHGRSYFSQFHNNQFLSFNGLFGVELFFVLSGFLIGGILIKEVVPDPTWEHLRRFYLRRWFRTLPLYWLVLGVLTIQAISLGLPIYFEHWFFLQNFDPQKINFFAVAWSLSIEEWFYLFIPLLLVIMLRLIRASRVKVFFVICISLVVLISLARLFYVLELNPDWGLTIRKHVLLRLDSLLIGVLLAGFKTFCKDLYTQAARVSTGLIAIGLVGITGLGIYYVTQLGAGSAAIIDHSIFAKTFFFNLISLVFAVLILGLETHQSLNAISAKHWLVRAVTFFSVTSYATYLVHYDIFFQLLAKYHPATVTESIGLLIIAVLLTYGIAFLLYQFYEQPILRLRDRLTQKKSLG